MNNKTTRPGFTLIETLLYIVIFSIVIMVIVEVGIFLAVESQQTMMREQLTSEASTAFSEVMRTIQTGDNFDSMNSTLNQTLSVIQFTDKTGDTVRFGVDNQVLDEIVNGGSPISLHSSAIVATEFRVERLNPTNNVPLFKVTAIFSDVFNQTFSLSSSVNFIHD